MTISFTPIPTPTWYNNLIRPRRLYRKRTAQIPGEYQRVSEWSTQYFRLSQAHSTPITRENAYELIKKLALRYSIKNLLVEWIAGRFKGRGGKKKGRPFVQLPTEAGSGVGYLRVGLVLHEFAHVIRETSANPGMPHGREFVATLDKLLVEEVGQNDTIS